MTELAKDASSAELSAELQQRLAQAQVAQAEAAARSAAIKADKDAADARTAQITALLPDLSKVKGSTLDVKDGPALFGTRLTYQALATAATKVSAKVTAAIPPDKDTANHTGLVTTNADLASADANHRDVTTGLQQLEAAAAALLDSDLLSTLPDPTFDSEIARTTQRYGSAWFTSPATALATAVATALLSVLSLLPTQRSVITGATDTNDLAAAAAVAGALRTRN